MHQHGYIGRKMRLPDLKAKPALIIAAFGSTNRGKAAIDIFRERVEKEFPEYTKFWAYTSEIIRKKMGLPSLQETLAKVEAMGYRKAVVQPLHIFPGTEYQQMAETCEYFPGLRVLLSETLLHRWDLSARPWRWWKRNFSARKKGSTCWPCTAPPWPPTR